MEIELNNVWLTITKPRPIDPEISRRLQNALKYRPDGYTHDFRYRMGQWSGWETLWDSPGQRCRIGNAERIFAALGDAQYSVTDKTVRTGATIDYKLDTGGRTPREYQVNCKLAARKHHRGIISSPTGSGKTLIMGMILDDHKMKSLVVLNDLVLLGQTYDELDAMFDCHIGMIGDSVFDIGDITVATVQSLITILRSDRPKKVPQSAAEKKAKKKPEYRVRVSPNRDALLEFMSEVQMVIHDEVHFADSKGIDELYPNFVNLERAYGLSATPYPFTADGIAEANIQQEQHFGRVIYDTVHEGYDFVELGAKVPVIVQVQEVPAERKKFADKLTTVKRGGKWARVPDGAANYREALSTQVLTNTAFHRQVADTVIDLMEGGLSNFVFAPHSLDYLRSIASMIPGSVVVTGKVSRDKRKQIFEDLGNKKILCVVSDIGSVGLNIPSLDVIHNCSDFVDIRQLEGRVARAAPGKQCGMFYDYAHIGVDFLDGHFRTRMDQYRVLGNLVLGAPVRTSML